jgi:hypothetical protein
MSLCLMKVRVGLDQVETKLKCLCIVNVSDRYNWWPCFNVGMLLIQLIGYAHDGWWR